MRKIFTFLALLSITASYSQTDAEYNEFTTEICNSIKENAAVPDSTKISSALERAVPVFMQDHNIQSEEQLEAMLNKVYARMHRNCPEFVEIIIKSDRNASEWTLLDKAPVSKIQRKECLKLTTAKRFYYLDYDGTKIHVTIDNNKWAEKFEDGSFASYNFKWAGDCEYELEFTESNNEVQKDLNLKGDKYNYVVYESKGNDLKFYRKAKTGKIQATVLHAE